MSILRVTGRQSGKLTELSAQLAERTNLSRETCVGLLSAGWTYMEFSDKPSRWESPADSMVRNDHVLLAFDCKLRLKGASFDPFAVCAACNSGTTAHEPRDSGLTSSSD